MLAKYVERPAEFPRRFALWSWAADRGFRIVNSAGVSKREFEGRFFVSGDEARHKGGKKDFAGRCRCHGVLKWNRYDL